MMSCPKSNACGKDAQIVFFRIKTAIRFFRRYSCGEIHAKIDSATLYRLRDMQADKPVPHGCSAARNLCRTERKAVVMASLNLTLRQRKLLHTIQNRRDMITGQELAGLLNASARTIRSDVVTINHELKPYGASIDSVRSKGYFFTAEDPEKIRQLNRIETAFFTREDRIRALALELCIAEKPLNCFDLEDEMFISRTTLENDIRLLRLRYMMNDPKIRVISGHSDISFEEDELKRRKLLTDLYMEHWNYNGRGNAVYGMSYLDPDLLDRIIDMIPPCLNRHGIRMEDTSIVELNLACTILCRRVSSGHMLPDAEPLLRGDSQADSACEELLDALEKELSLQIPLKERDQIYLLLASGHMMDSDTLSFENVKSEFSPRVIGMADAYIAAIRDVFRLDFSNDEDFYITILQDIRYLMNPAHRLVSQDRPGQVKQHLITETEFAWLLEDIWMQREGSRLTEWDLLHIAHCTSGALEYFLHYHPEYKPRTVIFCHQHMSIAWAIKRKVLGAFDNYLNITALLPVYEKSSFDFSDTDLVLTTVQKPITDHPGTDVVRISPYVTPADIRTIETYIQEHMILRFYPQMASLKELLRTAVWQEDCEFSSVFSAIEQLSAELVQTGAVGPDYAAQLLHRESILSNAIRSGALFQFSLVPADKTRLLVTVLKHRMNWGSCRIRLILTASFRPEDRLLLFKIKHGIDRLNRSEDIGSLRTRRELEPRLLACLRD